MPEDKGLIVFDGYCVLCNSTVAFLVRIDKKKKFLYTTFESQTWKNLSEEISPGSNSVILLMDSKSYIQSEAVIRIIQELGYPWRLLNFIRIMPFKFREKLYLFIAKHRYKVFGRKEICGIPEPNVKRRYLE